MTRRSQERPAPPTGAAVSTERGADAPSAGWTRTSDAIERGARRSSRGRGTAGRTTGGHDRSAGRLPCAPCSISRTSIKRGSTTCLRISRSPRSHTSWRRSAGLILPNWRASSRRVGTGAPYAAGRLLHHSPVMLAMTATADRVAAAWRTCAASSRSQREKVN